MIESNAFPPLYDDQSLKSCDCIQHAPYHRLCPNISEEMISVYWGNGEKQKRFLEVLAFKIRITLSSKKPFVFF